MFLFIFQARVIGTEKLPSTSAPILTSDGSTLKPAAKPSAKAKKVAKKEESNEDDISDGSDLGNLLRGIGNVSLVRAPIICTAVKNIENIIKIQLVQINELLRTLVSHNIM